MSGSVRGVQPPLSRPLSVFLVVVALIAAARFGVAVYRAPSDAKGDFHATLPGAHARTLNPTLWNSPDLAGSRGYHNDIYVYGPTQYLLLYPIAWLDSYGEIAAVLAFVYGAALLGSLYLMSRLLDHGRRFARTLPVVATVTLLFSPVYQAYIQREFEMVVFLVIVAAAALLLSGRDRWAGGLLGVIAWFKVWPIAFAGYFLITRRFKSLAAFVAASCVVIGLAHAMFGLQRFIIFNPSLTTVEPGGTYIFKSLLPSFHGASYAPTLVKGRPAARGAVGRGFCRNWFESEETAVGVRWALCRLGYSHPWFPPTTLFWLLALGTSAAAAFGFARIRRLGALTEDERRWIIVYEMSLVVIAAALVLSAHYYYFLYLTLPLSALASRYLRQRLWIRFSWLALAYLLLTVFLLPLSLMTRLYGVNFWRFYLEHVLYFYGEAILIALLLWEYIAIGAPRRDPPPAGSRMPR